MLSDCKHSKMSTQEVQPKRRGRPPKKPEDKIQDMNAYKREWYATHKDDEDFKNKIKEYHTTEEYKIQHRKASMEKQKRTRQLYVLVKKMSQDNIIDALPEEYKKEIEKLVRLDEPSN